LFAVDLFRITSISVFIMLFLLLQSYITIVQILRDKVPLLGFDEGVVW